jgi:hypothetical protein
MGYASGASLGDGSLLRPQGGAERGAERIARVWAVRGGGGGGGAAGAPPPPRPAQRSAQVTDGGQVTDRAPVTERALRSREARRPWCSPTRLQSSRATSRRCSRVARRRDLT